MLKLKRNLLCQSLQFIALYYFFPWTIYTFYTNIKCYSFSCFLHTFLVSNQRQAGRKTQTLPKKKVEIIEAGAELTASNSVYRCFSNRFDSLNSLPGSACTFETSFDFAREGKKGRNGRVTGSTRNNQNEFVTRVIAIHGSYSIPNRVHALHTE